MNYIACDQLAEHAINQPNNVMNSQNNAICLPNNMLKQQNNAINYLNNATMSSRSISDELFE